MIRKLLIILLIAILPVPGYPKLSQDNKPGIGSLPYLSLTEFGARGDGITDDTKAIQAAIDSCASSGIKLVFPSGVFVSGTIYLRSNLAIELSSKAVWLGIGNVEAYPVQHPVSSSGNLNPRRAMIYGEDIYNVSISGTGMFNGNGEHAVFQSGIADSPERPFGLWIIRGSDIRIEGIQMRSSAYWMQNYEECDHLRITGIRVFNHSNLNNDGIDISDCHDVFVSDCEFDSTDDALCLKSHTSRGVSDVVITNCVVATHAHGFKLGTASKGGFRHIAVNNLIVRESRADKITHQAKVKGGESGIELLSSDGGILEDVTIMNVVMDGLETPLCIKLGDRWANRKDSTSAVPEGTPGIIRNILIGNLIARRSGPIPSSITGYPGHYVENVVLRDMLIEIEGGLPEQAGPVPENSGNYPFNRIYGKKLPVYGFFVRHVNDIQFKDIRIKTLKADKRRAFIFEDATGVLDNVEILNADERGNSPVLADKAGTIELTGSSRKQKMQIHK